MSEGQGAYDRAVAEAAARAERLTGRSNVDAVVTGASAACRACAAPEAGGVAVRVRVGTLDVVVCRDHYYVLREALRRLAPVRDI